MYCPPVPNLYVKMWFPIGGRAFERLLGPSDGTLINGVRVLIKDTQQGLALCHEKLQGEETRSRLRSLESAGPLIVDFQASRTVRNDVGCLSHAVYGIFVIVAQAI